MKVNAHIFRGYDLRGLVDTDLSEEIAEHLGRAYGTMLQQDGHTKALVGRDCRASGPAYSEALIRGLNQSGIDVIDIGMVLVGMFYWAQYHLQTPVGVYVSASHNPPQYNGFKFANGYSETLVTDGMIKLRETVESEAYHESGVTGSVQQQDISEAYYTDILERLPLQKGLRVVVDPGCTTAGAFAPELLRRAGCDVVEYNTKVSTDFPLGVADPTETHVAERLRAEVLEAKADLGFTYDADGDRLGVVDGEGGIIWNDVLVALFATDVLADHPGATIMFNTLCSKTVPETITAHGGMPFMWRTGHSFLKKKNQEVKGAFIGELSGHFFFSEDFYNHDDGLYSSMRLLRYLTRTGKTLAQAVKELPLYKSSPEIKVFCADDKKQALIAELAPQLRQKYPEAEVIDDERAGDGLRLELADSMFVVRYSQNGPYLTVKFEAKSAEQYEKLRSEINALLHERSEVDWESSMNANVEALNS